MLNWNFNQWYLLINALFYIGVIVLALLQVRVDLAFLPVFGIFLIATGLVLFLKLLFTDKKIERHYLYLFLNLASFLTPILLFLLVISQLSGTVC